MLDAPLSSMPSTSGRSDNAIFVFFFFLFSQDPYFFLFAIPPPVIVSLTLLAQTLMVSFQGLPRKQREAFVLSQQRQRAQLTTGCKKLRTPLCANCANTRYALQDSHTMVAQRRCGRLRVQLATAPGSTRHTASPATSGPAHTKHSHFVHKYI